MADDSSTEVLLRSVIALLADSRERDLGRQIAERKTELILHSAGLEPKEIAVILNKNYEAVRKTIQRGRETS